jgi:hypothetical protein
VKGVDTEKSVRETQVRHRESDKGFPHRVTHSVLRHRESKEGILLNPKEERISSAARRRITQQPKGFLQQSQNSQVLCCNLFLFSVGYFPS